MPLLVEDLGGEVLRGAANCVGTLFITSDDLGQAEVSQLDVALLVEKDVFGFEAKLNQAVLSVNNFLAVEGLQSHENLSCIKFALFLGKLIFDLKQPVELAARAIFNHKVQFLLILEGKVQLN